MYKPIAREIVRIVAAVALLGLAATNGEAIDLTGTWEGTTICKGLDDGAKVKWASKTTVKITQTGSDLNMDFDGTIYNGLVQSRATDPSKGIAIGINCETSPSLAEGNDHEMGHVTVDGDKLKGVAVSASDDGFLICKFSGKRTSTADPGVGACP